MATDPVLVYFDYISPYAYFLAERMSDTVGRTGAPVRWMPIRLLGLENFANGLPYERNRIQYNVTDVPRSAAFYGLPLKRPSVMPIRSEKALCVALATRDAETFPKLHREVVRAAWAEDRDIGEDAVLTACLERAGIDAAPALARAAELRATLDAETQAAQEAGVFGVPTAAYRGELFWGADRLAMLEWRIGDGDRNAETS